MGAAALATVPFLIFERGFDPDTVWLADVIIWLIFLLAFLTVLLACRTRQERWDWIKRSWLEILIIIGSFPLMPSSLNSLRTLRVTQLFRVLRLGRILAIAYFLRWTREKFAISPVAFAGTVAILTAILGANALHILEPDKAPTLGTGMWWAITTMTTVGYGDISPSTPEGRMTGSFLMVFGVAIMASFSGYLASFLVAENEEDNQADLAAQLRQIQTQLERLEQILASHPQLVSPQSPPNAPED